MPAHTPPPSTSPVSAQLNLAPVDTANRPPAPSQWAGGHGGIPSNQWWSSAVVGPGSKTLWSTPLATRIDPDGTVVFANEVGAANADGTVTTPFIPALSVVAPTGGADTSVVAAGDFHVRLRLTARIGAATTDLTLTRGNVLAELAVDSRSLGMFVPGLKVVSAQPRWALIDTAEGRWVLAADQPVTWNAGGDRLAVRAETDRFNLVLGPEPSAAPPGAPALADVAVAVAANPVTDTVETLTVDERGATTQTLRVTRAQDTPTLLALLPHHEPRLSEPAVQTLGRIADPQGNLRVALTTTLTLTYTPVPILWSAVAANPTPTTDTSLAADGPEGSYFGGKYAYTAAALADLPVTDRRQRLGYLTQLRAQFDRLLDPKSNGLAWEPTWGAVVLQPAEFGSSTELNDHQLQYGYWVAAASILADADPAWATANRVLIDVLVADYAGAATVPTAALSGLAERRTWSPYDGHSWASGVVPFDDGNNLESISEAAFSSWAAARWFVVTARPELAEPFLARFTIENALAAGRWLPNTMPAPNARPWSGVVWASKIDNGTWFDPRPEAALGIRLLPLSPASLARYPDANAQSAARSRWAWCDRYGEGCAGLWPNLLASDAVVAGHAPPPSGSEDEPSTTAPVLRWWTDLWTESVPAEGWSCSAGAVARTQADGKVSALAANPTRDPLELSCWDGDGDRRWQRTLAPSERGDYPVR